MYIPNKLLMNGLIFVPCVMTQIPGLEIEKQPHAV